MLSNNQNHFIVECRSVYDVADGSYEVEPEKGVNEGLCGFSFGIIVVKRQRTERCGRNDATGSGLVIFS